MRTCATLSCAALLILASVLKCQAQFWDFYPQNDEQDADLITWSRLENIFYADNLKEFKRTSEETQKYKNFQQSLAQKESNINQFIKEKIMGYGGSFDRPCYFYKALSFEIYGDFDMYIQADAQQLEKYPWLKTLSLSPFNDKLLPNSKIIMLTENAFKYPLASNIHHWIIWSSSKLFEDELEQVFESLKLPYNYLLHAPVPKYQSVKDVYHAHLFIKYNE